MTDRGRLRGCGEARSVRITGVRRVRAAPAHYFSTHGSSRFGAEDAAIVGMFPRDLARSKSWEVKKDHNSLKLLSRQGRRGGPCGPLRSVRWPGGCRALRAARRAPARAARHPSCRATCMVKAGEISGFGGGSLEQPRPWLGARWLGLYPGSAELSGAARGRLEPPGAC